jgi:hypothetical protein
MIKALLCVSRNDKYRDSVALTIQTFKDAIAAYGIEQVCVELPGNRRYRLALDLVWEKINSADRIHVGGDGSEFLILRFEDDDEWNSAELKHSSRHQR